MKVLVTGSSGLIGTALVARLVSEGHSVIRLVRASSPPPAATDGITDVRWDPDAATIDRASLDSHGHIEGVVHLAGAGIGDRRWSRARKEVIVGSRTRSTATLADTLAGMDPPPAVLVSGSAVGIYGDRGEEILSESSTLGSGFLADLCRSWERATSRAEDAGVRTVHLRSGIVLARSGGALRKQLPLFRLGLGGHLGRGTQYRSWITLEDEVSAILHCLLHAGAAGPVNATAPAPATDATLAKAVGAALHRPAVLPVPACALRLALGAEMTREMILASQRAVPEALTSGAFTFAHPDVGEAVRSALAPGS